MIRFPNRHLRSAAYAAMAKAVASGDVTRPRRCSECESVGRVEGHHEDYAKPLAVRWLCRACHAAAHSSKNGGRLVTRVPPDLEIAVRVQAARERRSAARLVEQAVREYLARAKGEAA